MLHWHGAGDTNTNIIRRRAGGGHVAQCSSTVCSLLSRCAFCDVWHCRGHVRRYTRIHADRRMCHGSKLHYSALALSGYGPDKRATTAAGVASRRRGGRLFSAWHRFPLTRNCTRLGVMLTPRIVGSNARASCTGQRWLALLNLRSCDSAQLRLDRNSQ